VDGVQVDVNCPESYRVPEDRDARLFRLGRAGTVARMVSTFAVRMGDLEEIDDDASAVNALP
jgi:hypothetical protein